MPSGVDSPGVTQLAPDFAGNERFQVLARIGAGGMGVVYDVYDREQKTRRALKALRTLGGDALMRFKNEFRALSDLHHANLVSLGELIEDGGQWFFTMELIDGNDLLSYVRPDGKLDAARLRDTLSQLGRGLAALHTAGKVHRDIKPSNVRVTPDGRVVLLDLGLVTDVAREGAARTSSQQVVGTAPYMAPEQAQSKPVSAAADWYAVGVVLYEALTGDVPFSGAPLEVLMRKQSESPRPPRQLCCDAPPDLETLCLGLLTIDPTQRAGGNELSLACGASAMAPMAVSTSGPVAVAAPFVGRANELSALQNAFAATREHRTVAVLVQGESGVGKTALVRRFADAVAARGAVVLAGRCYERENVPYKALDGVIDALTRYMLRIDRADAAALLPVQTALLAMAFPVLLRVDAVARAPRPTSEVRDPLHLRTRVFAAVRELLGRLAERRPLVVVIDDLQWADADSLALLAEIMRAPEAPSLLLVATTRSDGADGPAPACDLGQDVRTLPLSGLLHGEARELVEILAAGAPLPVGVEAIAAEAAGHPLFIDEMVRHALTLEARPALLEARPALRLDEALWARLQRLPAEERRIVALVATAGAPLWLETAARAADEDDFQRFSARIAALRAQRLVRTSGAKRRDVVEPYHDRVRQAMTAHLTDDDRIALHACLARALEWSGQFDPEAASAHWQGAGQADKAARYAAIAAARAAQALAFDRAAELYRRSLALRLPDGAEGRSLQIKLAETLANAGRGSEAAAAFLQAKQGASDGEAFELQLRAADQYLRCGHIDEGLEAIRSVLEKIDMSPPAATPTRAIASLLLRRARLRLRGLAFTEREASRIDPRTMARIDASWSVAVALGTVDTIKGADFQTRNLILALDAGEPYRIARALTMESSYVATTGGPGRVRAARLLEVGSQLAERIGHPHAIGYARLAAGFYAFLLGRWQDARPRFAEAEQIFRERCSGCAWELDSVDLFSLWTRYYLGDMAELARLLPSRVHDATVRGDRYGVTNLRTRVAHVVALAADDPEAAEREAREAVEGWSHQGFHAQHYYQLFAQAEADLYRGDGPTAAALVGERWPQLNRSLLLEVQFIRLEALHLRARTQLAAARTAAGFDGNRVAAALADARRIERRRMPWATPLATLIRAGAAAVGGDRAGAATMLDGAAKQLDAAGMSLYATVARWRLGHIVDGDNGYALVTAANEWMQAQNVREPRRLAAVLAPGFAD
ncbi:MAG: Serine/threonine-protein kinase PknA [Myxococcales bacterium]|nr:Serine/threonine-protein kinase PknA [Myxococcales bacterium]